MKLLTLEECRATIARMNIGLRLKELREAKEFSQGDIEKRTGMLRCYVSRVENGHTVPSLETLERMANALEMPLYQLFYEGAELPSSKSDTGSSAETAVDVANEEELRFLKRISKLISKIDERDRAILLHTAQRLAKR